MYRVRSDKSWTAALAWLVPVIHPAVAMSTLLRPAHGYQVTMAIVSTQPRHPSLSSKPSLGTPGPA